MTTFADYTTDPSGTVCPGAEVTITYDNSADAAKALEAFADVHGYVTFTSAAAPTSGGHAYVTVKDPSSGEHLLDLRCIPAGTETTFAALKAVAG